MASVGAFDLVELRLYADNEERILICYHSEYGYAFLWPARSLRPTSATYTIPPKLFGTA